MQSNTYTAFCGFLLFILLNLTGLPTALSQEEGDIFDLRFNTEIDCGANVLTANLQIRTQNDTFKIGISSVLFNYDETVLEFLDYESLNFDQNNICIPGVPLAVWDAHQFSSSTPGIFNLTLLTEIASQSCPIIERDWIDIGKVRFTIKNITGAPNMQFDARNTTFNRNEPNDGTFAPTQGDLFGFNEILTTQCACAAPTLVPDTLSYNCPEGMIEANLLANDMTSNPTVSISNNPTKGTATINPNGILIYTPTTASCGEDVLTYKVCNDGKEDCCTEAIATISFSDNTSPIIMNPPADVTLACDDLPVAPNLLATDDCPSVELTMNEVIEDSDCAGEAVYTRTWTAVDVCGNTAAHTQRITLTDQKEPTITCPAVVNLLCSDVSEGVIDSGQPTVSDNCTPTDDLKVSFSDEVIAENCENKVRRQIARTWTVIDACGNLSTCSQTINIIDDIAPELICPRNLIVDCGQDITPETLESQATATDACGTTTITFEDDVAMPSDCNFETKTIKRTWTAVDDCGNIATCIQTITVNGKPCGEVTARELTIYRCEKGIVDFTAILEVEENVTISISNKSDLSPIFNLQQYALPSTGCEIGQFEFTFEVFNADQCLIDHGLLTVKTVPIIFAEPSISEDGCTVSLIFECPDHYSVTWNAGEKSGVGTTYTATAGTSGEVVFSVVFIGEILPSEAASLPCIERLYPIIFNCESTCLQTETQQTSFTTCAGQNLNIFETLNLSSDALDYTFELIDAPLGISLDSTPGKVEVENPFGCEMGTFNLRANGYDANQCLIKAINIAVSVLPKIAGSIQYESDSTFCSPKLVLECPSLYGIDWKDNIGNSGVGNSYTGADGTGGFVTFYVYPIEENLSELPCAVDSFFADFSCKIDCPTTRERTETLTVCAESEVDIIELLGLSEDKRNTFDNETITNGIYKVGNPFGCELGTKTLTLKCYDENQCLTEIITLQISIIPAIYAVIHTTADVACGVSLSLECPGNYAISWEDSNGNSGTGQNYTGPEGTSGTVKFTIEYLTDSIFLSSTPLACFSQTFEAAYDCNSNTECPDPAFETIDLYGCHGELLNLFDRLQFSDNIRYRIVDGDGIEDIKNIRLENDGTDCFIRQSRLAIEVMDERDCVIRSIFVSFNVLPKIDGDIVANEDGCGMNLRLTCPNIYAITWEDDLGNSGQGFSYEPAEGTHGVVHFRVAYKDTSVAEFFIDSTCYVTTFSQDFACCNPAGTACDDGDALTFNDVEDGDCGCFGTGCNLEYKGIVIDGATLDGCELVIELEDGTILEPLILPVGETLAVGQEIIFSFIELIDRVTTCQVGKNVQIICLENTCPAAGTPCTDNDLATINDEQDGNCNCVGEAAPEIKSEIDLRLRSELDCQANTYCLTLQAKGQQTDFTIGTSSIMLNYDPNALEFVNYTSSQFDESETCIGGAMSPWDEQKSDGTSIPGKFCLTMTLLTDSISCPEITTEQWEDIGVICFDIMNNDTTPNIKFDAENTHFNSSSPNDGTRPITLGTLHSIDADEALACEGNAIVSSNELALKAFLQGPYQSNKSLMADDLRKKGFIPLTEPYTGIPSFIHFGTGGGEETTLDVLANRGDNAIIDWVFLELRAESDSTLIVATRSALIQSDGDVVDVDGTTPVRFMVPDGAYYVCIKHRNHLGVMTATPIPFTATETVNIDFTDSETPTYGTHAQLDVQGEMVLRGGNANPDKFIILAGGGLGLPDRDMIFFDIFLSLWQSNPGIPITYNSVLQGYYGSDTNMDGKVKYQGPKNDIDAYIFFNVLFHPQNTAYRLNFAISEQIP